MARGSNNPNNSPQQQAAAAAQQAARAAAGLRGGVKAVISDAAAAQDALMGMGLAMATGASKAQVAMAGMREFLVSKLLGPLGQVGAAAVGLSASLLRLGRTFSQMGREGAGAIEKLEKSFVPLLQGAERAKQRVKELVEFAKSTPFELRGVVQANRQLQVLTKGALAGEKGMRLVGDAAAVAGRSMEEVALQVGRLYDGLQNGTPVGEAAFRLQELGLLSGQARAQIQALQDTGAAGSQVWAVAEADLKRYEGGMKAMSKTLENLQLNLEDTQEMAKTTFAKGYMDGMKAGLEAQQKAIEGLMPALQYMGEYLGQISGKWDQFKAGVVDATVGAKWFQNLAVPAFVAVTTALNGLAGSTGLTVLVKGFGMIRQAVSGARASAKAVRAGADPIQGPPSPGMSKLMMAMAGLDRLMGTVKFTQAAQKLAVFHRGVKVASTGVSGFSVVQYAATMAVAGFGLVLRMATTAVVNFGRAMLAFGAIGWAITAIVSLTTAMTHLIKRQRDGREASLAAARAHEEAAAALEREARAARTAADAQKVRQRALREEVELEEELIRAQERYAKAQADKGFIQKGMDWLAGNWELDKLQKTEEAIEDRRRRARKTRREMVDLPTFFDIEQASASAVVEEAGGPGLPKDQAALRALLESKRPGGPGDKAREATQRVVDELQAEIGKAELRGDYGEAERLRQRQRAEMMGSADESMRLRGDMQEVQAVRDKQGQVASLGERLKELQGQDTGGDDEAEAERQQAIAETTKMLEVQQAALKAMGTLTQAQVDDYNAAATALARLNAITAEQVAAALRAQQLADLEASYEMQRAVMSLIDDEVERMRELQRIEEQRRQTMVAMGEMSEADAQAARQKEAVERAALERSRERRVADGRVEVEQAILGLKDESLDRELGMLDIEEEKLRVALERKQLTQEEYDDQMRLIEARRAAAERDAARRRQAVVAEMTVTRYQMQGRAARLRGDFAGADTAQRQADAAGDAQFGREELLRLRAAGFDEATSALLVQEQIGQRILEREMQRAEAAAEVARSLKQQDEAMNGQFSKLAEMVRQERVRALTAQGLSAEQAKQAAAREQELADAKSGEDLRLNSLRTAADALRQRGDRRGARRYDRRADEIEERRRVSELIGEGVSEKQAKRVAKGERDMAELGRLQAESPRLGGQVAVNSLVRLGGGAAPNVSGATVDLQRRANNLLERIERNTREPKEEPKFGGVSLLSR